jgi:Bacterial regulatory helix-turn-helix protein, lysR family
MKPNQLLAFVAVVDQMSIRGAARAIGISQPAVTKIVRELERELGVALVERARGVRLAPCGEAFAPRAWLLLADMQRARDLRRSTSRRQLRAAEWVAPGNGETGRDTMVSLFSGMGLDPPALQVCVIQLRGHLPTPAARQLVERVQWAASLPPAQLQA